MKGGYLLHQNWQDVDDSMWVEIVVAIAYIFTEALIGENGKENSEIRVTNSEVAFLTGGVCRAFVQLCSDWRVEGLFLKMYYSGRKLLWFYSLPSWITEEAAWKRVQRVSRSGSIPCQVGYWRGRPKMRPGSESLLFHSQRLTNRGTAWESIQFVSHYYLYMPHR